MYNDDLYSYAEDKHIILKNAYVPVIKSFAMSIYDDEYIVIDEDAMENSAEERTHLAHELGHCETGAFYGVNAPEQVRRKAEAQATRWAVKKLIPKEKFEELLKKGYEVWELADYYNVTEEFIEKAYQLYYEVGMLT